MARKANPFKGRKVVVTNITNGGSLKRGDEGTIVSGPDASDHYVVQFTGKGLPGRDGKFKLKGSGFRFK